MSTRTRLLRDSERTAWDSFVRSHPEGSPFHLIAWRDSIRSTFGYKPVYLVAGEPGRITGVLPLFLVKSLLTGATLISTPFAVYGGVLAATDEAREALGNEARRLAEEFRVKFVDFRNQWPGQALGLDAVSRYVTFTAPVGPDEEALLDAIPRKTRAAIRKSLRAGFTTRRQTTDFSAFENLYSRNLRRLGTPAFPQRHFANLVQNFGDEIDIREVLFEGRVVAAVLSFYFRDRVLPYYGASDPALNALAPNNFMYFDHMRWAGSNGYRIYDFGRSKKVSGSFDFKVHWGMEQRDLPYEVLLVKRKTVPNFSPNNPKIQAVARVWRRLPLPITRVLGPQLLRMVP